MRKLVKKSDRGFSNVMHSISSNVKNRNNFFFANNKIGRFAVPRKDIYDSRNPNMDDYDCDYYYQDLAESMIKVIDLKRVFVGYEPSNGHFRLCVAFTTEKLLDAVKHAKKHSERYVVDLKTGKLLETNG